MRRGHRVLHTGLIAFLLGACGGDLPSGPISVATVQVTSPNAVIIVEDTEQLSATTAGAGGVVLTGRAITWTSRDPAVATVTPSGIATGVAPGVATIEATSEGKRGERALTVVAPSPPVSAAGQLFMIDGLAPGPLTAALRVGASRPKSVSVGLDGRFALSSVAPGDLVELLIDGPSGAYLPSLIRFARSAPPAPEVRILLAPRRWTIDGGTYASTTIDVSASQAFTPPCTTAGDANCDGYYPQVVGDGHQALG